MCSGRPLEYNRDIDAQHASRPLRVRSKQQAHVPVRIGPDGWARCDGWMGTLNRAALPNLAGQVGDSL